MQRALVLGGGGFRGSAHLGVYSQCERHGLEFGCVVGTSIGALVGAFIAAGYSSAATTAILQPLSLRHLLARDRTGLGLVGMQRVEARLRQVFGQQRIEDLAMPFAAVTVDVHTHAVVVCNHGDLVAAILASCAIPGLFAPQLINGQWLADGGLINNVPVDVARSLGADWVLAVDVIGAASTIAMPTRRQRLRTALQFAEHSFLLMMRTITAQHLRQHPPDVLITPDVDAASVGGFLDFNTGFQAGVAAFGSVFLTNT